MKEEKEIAEEINETWSLFETKRFAEEERYREIMRKTPWLKERRYF